MPKSKTIEFPAGFTWGAATASYQIEGAIHEGGRGPSIWDTFSHTPGNVHHNDNGDIACDHYHRQEEDLELIGNLGLTSYRFSIAWPRIQPTGKGPANQAGIDFYKRLCDGLLARGIAPVATIYHWDLPQALEDAGGWRVRDTAHRFSEYAQIVGESLGSQVHQWITLNEPWCSSWLGHGTGFHAPGMQDIGAALSANHYLLVGHGLAVQALRSTVSTQIGITLNLAHVRPGSDHPKDIEAAHRVDGNANRLFLDPIFRGAYPKDMMDHYAKDFPTVESDDLQIISQPLDFLGINYYHPTIIISSDRVAEGRAAGLLIDTSRPPTIVDADLGVVAAHRQGVPRTTMDWEIEPEGLSELLIRVSEQYTKLPIYITENGRSSEDYVSPEGEVNDVERVNYVREHLGALSDAMSAGVNIAGYYIWSLLDNFEWNRGYAKRFGIIWVDYDTGRRIPKKSYYWYREVVKSNRLETLDTVDH